MKHELLLLLKYQSKHTILILLIPSSLSTLIYLYIYTEAAYPSRPVKLIYKIHKVLYTHTHTRARVRPINIHDNRSRERVERFHIIRSDVCSTFSTTCCRCLYSVFKSTTIAEDLIHQVLGPCRLLYYSAGFSSGCLYARDWFSIQRIYIC